MPTIEALPGGQVYVAPGSGLKDWSYGIELARQWPGADEVYDTVHRVTGIDVYDVCSRPKENPETNPAVAQPAALAVGYASAEFLRQEIGPPDFLMGLSAGEFTVAAISGALDLKDAAALTKKRGELQSEVAGGKGGSAMILMHDRLDHGRKTKKQIQDAIATIPGVHISNYHTPFKLGVGFKKEAFEGGKLIDKLGVIKGVRRAIHNKGVEFPPHGEDVVEAEEMLATFFSKTVKVKDATVPVMANYTGRLMKKSKTIRNNLIWQTTSPTQLGRGMAYLINRDVTRYIDIGPDNAMEKLLGDFEKIYEVEIISAVDVLQNSLQ